jgi:nitrite reductase (cytochrome c-552)
MLQDQEHTRRVTERPQPGACLHCHASAIPTYRRLGRDALGAAAEGKPDFDVVFAGFQKTCLMTYKDAHAEIEKTGSMNPELKGKDQVLAHADGAHPVSCVDCHDPKTMQLRVTRPGFIKGIAAYQAKQGRRNYDPNKEATRQEMRTFVCAQCHVEYYCGPKETVGNDATLFFPWGNGIKVEEIEETYNNTTFKKDGHRFYDWAHAETGAELLKAQHPEFEMYNQGIHAQSGVACADCHMPYERQGAMKVSDHWVRSPVLNIAKACQTCHPFPEAELKARVDRIQDRSFKLLDRSGKAAVEFFDTVKALRKPFDDQNRAAAEAEARADLEKDAAYKALPADQQQAKLKTTSVQKLNEKWAAKVRGDQALAAMAELHRKAQWRLDFVAAENSMGFHAPQESARILGESIDYFRQAKEQADMLRLGASPAASQPIPVPTTQAGITGPLDPTQTKIETQPAAPH